MSKKQKRSIRKLRSLITIEDMTIDDLPKVFHLGEKAYLTEFPLLYRTWDEFEVTDYFNTDPDLCVVAKLNSKVIGFAIGKISEKAKSAWKYGYISWIGVSKGYQRLGLGRRLYKRLESKMEEKGARMILLDTELSNTDALTFFKRLGFQSSSAHVWLTKLLKE
ncbi:MAG: GNAT family N-acetyltransferase [Nitrososphaerales archaeon]